MALSIQESMSKYWSMETGARQSHGHLFPKQEAITKKQNTRLLAVQFPS